MVHPHKDALLRPWWNILHHWTGRLLLVLAVVNIWEGMSLLHPAMPAWPYLYGLPLGLLVLVASVLEAFSLWRWISEDAPQTQVQVRGTTLSTCHSHLVSSAYTVHSPIHTYAHTVLCGYAVLYSTLLFCTALYSTVLCFP